MNGFSLALALGFGGDYVDTTPPPPPGTFTYLRTDGTSIFLRSDGTSSYFRP